jgi:hypothetical protein
MKSIAVRVSDEVRDMMKKVDVKWAEYLREAIQDKLNQCQRQQILKRLSELSNKIKAPPKGAGASLIRDDRDA